MILFHGTDSESAKQIALKGFQPQPWSNLAEDPFEQWRYDYLNCLCDEPGNFFSSQPVCGYDGNPKRYARPHGKDISPSMAGKIIVVEISSGKLDDYINAIYKNDDIGDVLYLYYYNYFLNRIKIEKDEDENNELIRTEARDLAEKYHYAFWSEVEKTIKVDVAEFRKLRLSKPSNDCQIICRAIPSTKIIDIIEIYDRFGNPTKEFNPRFQHKLKNKEKTIKDLIWKRAIDRKRKPHNQ